MNEDRKRATHFEPTFAQAYGRLSQSWFCWIVPPPKTFLSLSHAFESKSKTTGPAQTNFAGNSDEAEMSVSETNEDHDNSQQATEH